MGGPAQQVGALLEGDRTQPEGGERGQRQPGHGRPGVPGSLHTRLVDHRVHVGRALRRQRVETFDAPLDLETPVGLGALAQIRLKRSRQ